MSNLLFIEDYPHPVSFLSELKQMVNAFNIRFDMMIYLLYLFLDHLD